MEDEVGGVLDLHDAPAVIVCSLVLSSVIYDRRLFHVTSGTRAASRAIPTR